MSIFTIENQGVNTYLVYKVRGEDKLDSLSFGMLTNNKIKGVAPILFTQMDSEKYLKYNISSKIPVSTYMKGTITRKKLLGVFSGISSAVMAAEEYMIDTSLFILDSDYIYVDATTNETILICLPVINCEHEGIDLQTFYKQIMYSSQFDQNENCDYIAPIINYLNSTSVFSAFDFKGMVDNLNFPRNKAAQSAYISKSSIPERTPERNSETQFVTQVSQSHKSSFSERSTEVIPANLSEPVPLYAEENLNSSNKALPPVPHKATKASKANTKVKSSSSNNEKEITLVTLLTKFSKENLELYKAQKGKANSEKDEKTKSSKSKKKTPVLDFAIPGENPSLTAEAPDKRVPTQESADLNKNKLQMSAKESQNSYHIAKSRATTPQTNNGETTVLISPGETTVLGASSVAVNIRRTAYLIRVKSGEAIAINKPRFRIGKERSYVDYFIGDNTAISRSHADIVERGGRYYIADMNSTNGTFVNGMVVPGGEEAEIEAGARIRLANEEFEFEIR